MILLDTNILVWFSMGVGKLGQTSRTRILQAQADDQLFVSVISAWEISMLVDKGRLELGTDPLLWMRSAINAGVSLIAITPEIGVSAGRLPGGIHGDPGDRIIIATARDLDCPLLTSDRKMLDYGANGHVRVSDARH